MAQDLAGVINQLRTNNEEEKTRDSSTNRNIAESRKQNTEALASLAKNLSEQFVTVVRTTDQDKQQREADQEKSAMRIAAGEKAWRTRQENAQKKKDGLASANEENQNRMMRVFTGLGAGIKGLNTKFGNFAKGFLGSIKEKAKGGIGAIMDIFKKFALVGALGALFAFFNSDLWKNLKKDYLDPIMESFSTLKEKLGGIGDTFDRIKKGFFDEEGNFTPIAGIKNMLTELGSLFEGTGAAFATIGGLTLFAFRKKLIRLATGVGSKLLSMSGLTNIFGKNLDTVNTDMKARNTKAKTRGIFSKGLRGMGGRFGKLFLRLGALGGLIGGASLLMGDKLKDAGGAKGVFAGIKNSFGNMFSKVGQFGSKITASATSMGAKVADSIKGGILSAKGALMSGFDNMFGALKNLGSGIKDLAGKASAKVKSTLKSTGADIDPDAKKKADADAAKKKKAQMDKFRNADMQSRSNLVDFNQKKAEIEAKKKADKLAADKKKAQMDLFKKADADSVKNYKATQKAAKEAAEKSAKEAAQKAAKKGAKETAEIVGKAATKSLLKKIPIVSIGAGLIFGAQRLLEGDVTGAGLEVLSGVAGTVPVAGTALSAGADATLLAKDLGAFDKKEKTYPIDGVITPDLKAADGNGVTPDPSKGGTLMAPSVINVDAHKESHNNSENIGIVGMRDQTHNGYRLVR
tara:strand:- start:90 stop:2156 length:2067 start_codon:yes stop_codon:yes gene_type:complete